VRDDARGGQLVKAKCGADVVVQLFQGSDPQPLLLPDVQLKVGDLTPETGPTRLVHYFNGQQVMLLIPLLCSMHTPCVATLEPYLVQWQMPRHKPLFTHCG
jgi:hypothetical protein